MLTAHVCYLSDSRADEAPPDRRLFRVREEPKNAVPQCPVPEPDPPCPVQPPRDQPGSAGLAGSSHQPIKPLQRLQCKAWPCWETPLPPAPDGEMLFSIQWEQKNSRKPRAES